MQYVVSHYGMISENINAGASNQPRDKKIAMRLRVGSGSWAGSIFCCVSGFTRVSLFADTNHQSWLGGDSSWININDTL